MGSSFRDSHAWSWIFPRHIPEFKAHRKFCSDFWESTNITCCGTNIRTWTWYDSTVHQQRKHGTTDATGNLFNEIWLDKSYFSLEYHNLIMLLSYYIYWSYRLFFALVNGIWGTRTGTLPRENCYFEWDFDKYLNWLGNEIWNWLESGFDTHPSSWPSLHTYRL